jgi:hypothetical protein
MNEKLNKLKQTVKTHRTEIVAISVAIASLGVAGYVIRKNDVHLNEPYLRMSSKDAKMIINGDNHVRFDTKYGPLVLKALIAPEN